MIDNVRLKDILNIKLRSKKQPDSREVFFARREKFPKKYPRYPADMLTLGGTPNWSSKTFFGYKHTSTEHYTIRVLIESRQCGVTHERLVELVARGMRKSEASTKLTVDKVLRGFVRKDPFIAIPGIGDLEIVDPKEKTIAINYDFKEAKKQHTLYQEL